MAINTKELLCGLPIEEAEYLLVRSALGARLHTDHLIDWDPYKRGDYRLSDGKRLGGSIVVLCSKADESIEKLELIGSGDRLTGDSSIDERALNIINASVKGTLEVHRPVN